MRKRKGWLILALAVVVLLAGVAVYKITIQYDQGGAQALGVGSVRLAVDWGGDVYRSERADCGVWQASFNCELRRGGDLGVVLSRTLPIMAAASVGEPGTGQWGSEVILTWDTSELDVGEYETFVRLEVTDGEETVYGYVEGEGQDGDMFILVDKFRVGEPCFCALRYQ